MGTIDLVLVGWGVLICLVCLITWALCASAAQGDAHLERFEQERREREWQLARQHELDAFSGDAA